ncbi:M23 family metallopeptidase [Pseudothioclava arenosa]|uniref:Peptidase M23 n=1 Tax=Pseudothioclava arenosa TaxID=1795308 RepID=A0A2A4CQZ2_9RHOB|nr:M23 family metallopeptidase [Pseudothioclava arenosa]PCD77661.1 peptidase M23 [Pseudothioclava arenosa]
MPKRLVNRVNSSLERWLPEQRLFIKSDDATRFIRLRPLTQAGLLAAGVMLFTWSAVASSLLFISGLSAGSGDQSVVATAAFEDRLVTLSQERDQRAQEAQKAQERFQIALGEVSKMQSQLLASEERRRELETGIRVIQTTLKRTMTERDGAREQVAALSEGKARTPGAAPAASVEMERTLALLSETLGATAKERDAASAEAQDARNMAEEIALEKRLLEERNDEIFSTLEGAVQVSMEPLDKMFRNVGMSPDKIIGQIRRGYSGTGGPLAAISLSSKGAIDAAGDLDRASGILGRLDEMNMYRMAVDKMPFALPVHRGQFRFTSPFGQRWGRLHAGVDLAGPVGTPIYAPADGVVIKAGRESGYGNMIRIQHEFGIKTIYGHLSRIRVKPGQKVSRGQRIGDMGNTGRSTGPHLHYEIRMGDKPINPMKFIKAGQDVF